MAAKLYIALQDILNEGRIVSEQFVPSIWVWYIKFWGTWVILMCPIDIYNILKDTQCDTILLSGAILLMAFENFPPLSTPN